MKLISEILIALVALLHVYILWLEMFAWTTRGKKTFKSIPADLFEKTKALAVLSLLCDKATTGQAIPLQKALKTFYGIQTPIYFKNASAGLYRNYQEIETSIELVMDKVIATPGLIYQVNTLGGKISDADFKNTSAYAHRHLPYLSELQAYWENPNKEKMLSERFEDIQNIFKQNGIKAQYINYPDLNFENWQEAYYGENYQRLSEIKKQYDPENQIRHEQSIT